MLAWHRIARFWEYSVVWVTQSIRAALQGMVFSCLSQKECIDLGYLVSYRARLFSSVELGMYFFGTILFFIIIDKVINKSPSQCHLKMTSSPYRELSRVYVFCLCHWCKTSRNVNISQPLTLGKFQSFMSTTIMDAKRSKLPVSFFLISRDEIAPQL